MRPSGDGSDVSQTASSEVLARPGLNSPTDVEIERLASADKILKLSRTRIARADQNEDTTTSPACAGQERLDGIAAEIGVDGQRVGIPDRMCQPFDLESCANAASA
jgi:hypothetical protein